MSSKLVMQYDEIKGDFQDETHKNWIEIQSMNFNFERAVLQETGNPKRNIGSPTISKIKITKKMDISTPALLLESLCGTGKNCVIRSLNGSDKLNPNMEYKLENVVISKYSVEDHASHSETFEALEISFTAIKTVYTPYDSAGKKGTPYAAGYNISQNQRI